MKKIFREDAEDIDNFVMTDKFQRTQLRVLDREMGERTQSYEKRV